MKKPINYPYLAGGLQAILNTIAIDLHLKGVIEYDKVDEIQKIIDKRVKLFYDKRVTNLSEE